MKFAALTLTVVGLALTTMMIVVESEPGALPLALAAAGAAWYAWCRVREGRARSR